MAMVLGISAFYHDSAAALVQDGRIVAAAQEERFSRKKHDPRFPAKAVNFCLEQAFIEPDELDAVCFYDNPLLTLDRVIKTMAATASSGAEQWLHAARSILGVKLFVTEHIHRALGHPAKVLFTDHHAAHAASAFFPSPFEQSCILTLDGVGEWATTTIGVGRGSEISILEQITFPHSLGLLYSAFTYFCGFKVNSGEYKLMGLAPYGEPRYADLIREHLIDIRSDGSFRLNMDYFGYLDTKWMINERFESLFGGPPRAPESRITRREMDIAASIQQVTEQAVLSCARHACHITGMSNLCLAGGVALNCVANGRLLREGVCENLWIQPAAGDAGGALGAALMGCHHHLRVPRPEVHPERDAMQGSYLGPEFSASEIAAFLDRHNYPYHRMPDTAARMDFLARALENGSIMGYFNGRMEFGPRSLGARSIIGDARRVETQSIMNLKIKYRESFRPFAPSVQAEHYGEYFDLATLSPYMLLVAPVREERRKKPDPAPADSEDLMQVVTQARSDIPAVTHVDYSARIQTVHKETNPEYHALIEAFRARTGCAVVVNTSFNVRGEPIVCSPRDAYVCFMRTEMDVLVLGEFVLLKEEQCVVESDTSWKEEYELD